MKINTFKQQATEVKPAIDTFAKIKVVGIGGAGGEAINRMIGSKIRGVDFITVNTDAQALHHSKAQIKIHIGKTATRGLGAGMDPEIGRRAAEESQEELHDHLEGRRYGVYHLRSGRRHGYGRGTDCGGNRQRFGSFDNWRCHQAF